MTLLYQHCNDTYVRTLVGSLVAVILASQGIVFVEDHVVVHVVISEERKRNS